MPDLLTCLTVGARVLVLGYAITQTAKLVFAIAHGREMTAPFMFVHGLSVALFVGLMGWLD